MSESRRNFMVGAFVLVGVISLCAIILLIGRGPAWLASGESYPLRIKFSTAAGIRSGNVATVGGIVVGRVSGVDFLDRERFTSGVIVTIDVKKRYPIPVGSTAITTEPVLGQGRPAIEIIPGGGPSLPMDRDHPAMIDGRTRGALEVIFPTPIVNTIDKATAQIGNAAEALTPALRELEEILKQRSTEDVDQHGMQGNLSSFIARLDMVARDLDDVIGRRGAQSELQKIIANAEQMSEDGKLAVADLKTAAADTKQLIADGRDVVKRVDSTVANFDTQLASVAKNANTVLEKGSTFLDYANTAGAEIASGKGTVGRLIMDDKLYEALVLTGQRMSQAVEEMRLLIADWKQGKIRVGL